MQPTPPSQALHYRAEPMFPGDLLDAAARFAADMAMTPAEAAWRQARAMGWPLLTVAEAHGGAGGTLADLAAVVEACARHASALPLIRRCALVPTLLVAARTSAADAALQGIAGGTLDADVASGHALTVERRHGGVSIHGLIESADAALPATHLLVPTSKALLLIPRERLPATWRRMRGIDGACTADMALDHLELPAEAVLASGLAASTAAAAAEDIAMLVTAIDIAATLGALIEHCIAHLSTRVQFGVALATFQVLRHRVVDLYVQYEAASVMLVRLVTDAVDGRAWLSRDVALAKLYLNDLARRGAEAAIQLHGGMGMTTELPATRLAQRLIAAEFEHGDRLALLDRLDRLDQPNSMPQARGDEPSHDAAAPAVTATSAAVATGTSA